MGNVTQSTAAVATAMCIFNAPSALPETASTMSSAMRRSTSVVRMYVTRAPGGAWRVAEGSEFHETASSTSPSDASSSFEEVADVADRETTLREEIIGELRSWNVLSANWDGEGAESPNRKSIREAVSFVALRGEQKLMPEPMLHSSGNAGLYWETDDFYADLEFLGDGRIAYYVEKGGSAHKGVVDFDGESMPTVFPAILDS